MTRPGEHQQAELSLVGGKLRVVVVADTHSRPHPESKARIRALAPDHILHAGDIGDPEVLTGLAQIAPVLAVRGNIDAGMQGVPDTITIAVRDGADTLIKLLLLHIAVYGPKLRADAARRARAQGADLVVCGHSHVPFAARDRGLTVFNPGSIGPRRFQLPIVFGCIDVSRERIDVRHIDCETGERWSPPPRVGSSP